MDTKSLLDENKDDRLQAYEFYGAWRGLLIQAGRRALYECKESELLAPANISIAEQHAALAKRDQQQFPRGIETLSPQMIEELDTLRDLVQSNAIRCKAGAVSPFEKMAARLTNELHYFSLGISKSGLPQKTR